MKQFIETIPKVHQSNSEDDNVDMNVRNKVLLQKEQTRS